jgi:hypothetical protein
MFFNLHKFIGIPPVSFGTFFEVSCLNCPPEFRGTVGIAAPIYRAKRKQGVFYLVYVISISKII